MAGHRSFKELSDRLDARPNAAERRRGAEAGLAEEIERYEVTLAQLRRARELTQVQLAKLLDVSQAQVSRVEHQTDVYLSTLQSYLAAMGGELELSAVFDDARVPITLEDLAEGSDVELVASVEQKRKAETSVS